MPPCQTFSEQKPAWPRQKARRHYSPQHRLATAHPACKEGRKLLLSHHRQLQHYRAQGRLQCRCKCFPPPLRPSTWLCRGLPDSVEKKKFRRGTVPYRTAMPRVTLKLAEKHALREPESNALRYCVEERCTLLKRKRKLGDEHSTLGSCGGHYPQLTKDLALRYQAGNRLTLY